MLVGLMELLTLYLAGKFPDMQVARGYDFYASIAEMERDARAGVQRLHVLPRQQLGTDTIQSRKPIIEREVGFFVMYLVKTTDFFTKTCDPLLQRTEEIRKSLWECGPFILSGPGYEHATFMRLDNATSGIPGRDSRLFEASMIPVFKVHYNPDKGS